MVERKCVGCGKIKDRKELIKITKTEDGIFVNPDNKKFGRSAYLCYNNVCVEAAFKKNKIARVLKTSIPEDLKGKIINEF